MCDDPARTFFPSSSEIPSLYSVLSVPSTATQDDLKRSYRRLSLLFHPDKASSSTSSDLTPEESTLKFQQIGFAYSVLKDEKRREKYDRTGSTVEGTSSGEGAKSEKEWRDYFKDLWQGEVTGESIEEFRQKYQGSEEEKKDLYDAYNASKGDLETILTSIMCSTNEDEERFIDLINVGISTKELKSTTKWKKQSKDTGAKEERKKKANKEAKEAEEYAKELGIHDKLFGGGGGGEKGSKKGKGKATKGGDDEDDDEAALKALIQGNRDKRMNSLVESLEAKYGDSSSKKRGGGGGENGGGSKKQKKQQKEEEPSEEEFARIQAELDKKRAKSSNGAGGNGKSRKSK